MIDYRSKKWLIMQPIQNGRWGVPDANRPWDVDCNIALGKLLRASASHVCNTDIDMTADIYCLLSAYTCFYQQEIDFCKKVRSLGKKVVLFLSTDYKFLTGQDLLSDIGILYSDLCNEVDLIVSGMPSHFKFFGRNQHKVIDMSIFLERVNFNIPYEQRDIDILLSGSIGRNEITLPFALELMCMLKEKYPDKRIVYPTAKKHILQSRYPQIEFQEAVDIQGQGLVPWLQKSKHYISVDVRPGTNRALIESLYSRTPYISSTMCYASKYYQDFTYDGLVNFETIMIQYENILQSDRNEIIQKSEQLAEEDYFDNAIKRIMSRLYPE